MVLCCESQGETKLTSLQEDGTMLQGQNEKQLKAQGSKAQISERKNK